MLTRETGEWTAIFQFGGLFLHSELAAIRVSLSSPSRNRTFDDLRVYCFGFLSDKWQRRGWALQIHSVGRAVCVK